MHELDSIMLFIHPPLAIIGYTLIFVFTILIFKINLENHKALGYLCLSAWLFTFLGLVTGMIWAQTAWGAYWSWDIKEVTTLIFFISVSCTLIAYREEKLHLSKWLSVSSCCLSVLTMLVSFTVIGLHSFV